MDLVDDGQLEMAAPITRFGAVGGLSGDELSIQYIQHNTGNQFSHNSQSN
jgi:hypothetical protein